MLRSHWKRLEKSMFTNFHRVQTSTALFTLKSCLLYHLLHYYFFFNVRSVPLAPLLYVQILETFQAPMEVSLNPKYFNILLGCKSSLSFQSLHTWHFLLGSVYLSFAIILECNNCIFQIIKIIISNVKLYSLLLMNVLWLCNKSI